MNENDPESDPVGNTAPETAALPETPAPTPEPQPLPPDEAPPAAESAVEDKTIIPIQTEEEPNREEIPSAVPPPAAGNDWARPGWLAVALVGLASSCLAVVLSLAILSLVNRGLSYAAPADVRALQAQIDTLQTRVDSATQDLAGLRARVDQLEELAARTTALERMALDLQAEIDKRVTQAEELKGAVEDVQTKISDVITQSKAFQSFVDGLRDLIDIFPKGQTP
jgi:hypothetical protein